MKPMRQVGYSKHITIIVAKYYNVRALRIILFGIWALFSVKRGQAQEWSLSAQFPGTVHSFTTQAGTIFAATDKGVFRLENKNWESCNNGLLHLFTWALIQKDSFLFAGTENGIYRSADNGASWSAVNNGLGFATVYAFACNGKELLAATYGGIYYSWNNGDKWVNSNKWTNRANGFEQYYTIVYSLSVADKGIYAATDRGVYFSGDSCRNWESVNGNVLDKSTVCTVLADNDMLYAGTYNGGLFVSRDNGRSWSALRLPDGDADIYVLEKLGTALYAGTSAGVYCSADSGKTWKNEGKGIPPSNMSVYAIARLKDKIFAAAGRCIVSSFCSQ